VEGDLLFRSTRSHGGLLQEYDEREGRVLLCAAVCSRCFMVVSSHGCWRVRCEENVRGKGGSSKKTT